MLLSTSPSRNVLFMASFTAWKPIKMIRVDDVLHGRYFHILIRRLPLKRWEPEGLYRFVVDGKDAIDPTYAAHRNEFPSG